MGFTDMTKARGVSLHIGVNFVDKNHYGGSWDGRLNACEKDCDDMQAIAKAQGFATNVLKSRQATREAVASTINDIAGQLKEGDFFLLTYSGHGGTIPDVDGDEVDQVDETWCLFDGQLLDDELNVLWAGFKAGVRLLVLSDSCHSGTMLKDIDLGSVDLRSSGRVVEPDEVFEYARAMPREIARNTARRNRQFYADLQYDLPDPRPEIRATVRLISGCQEDELSWEGKANDRFTAALKETFADGAFDDNYKKFHKSIIELVKDKQTPNHVVLGGQNEAYDRQRPFKI